MTEEIDYKALANSLQINIKTISDWAQKKEKLLDQAVHLLRRCDQYHAKDSEIKVFLESLEKGVAMKTIIFAIVIFTSFFVTDMKDGSSEMCWESNGTVYCA